MDSSNDREWDRYRMLITRDGAGWRATAEGRGLPGDGRFIRDKTIAGLNKRTSELFGDLSDRTCWHVDYESAASPVALHDWGMSRHDIRDASRKIAKDGHALASALAADGATIREIAEATRSSYLNAAWLLATQPPPARLFGTRQTARADSRRYYRSSLTALLRVIAADSERELARLRS